MPIITHLPLLPPNELGWLASSKVMVVQISILDSSEFDGTTWRPGCCCTSDYLVGHEPDVQAKAL